MDLPQLCIHINVKPDLYNEGYSGMRNRRDDLSSFYRILEKLKQKMNGPLLLSGCSGRMSWPARGVYFFMEPGEVRKDSGTGLRIVRVGTHALNLGSTATLWRRLSQH